MGLLDWLFGDSDPPPRQATRAAPSTPQRSVNATRAGLRNTQPFYVERGWKVQGDSLRGFFRTRYGAVEGRIDQPFSGSPIYSMMNPPQKLLDGPHGGCFRQKEATRFEIHWNTKPKDVNAGILQVEHLLIETLR